MSGLGKGGRSGSLKCRASFGGAAQRIAGGMMKLFGQGRIQWALLITGFIIGIPLFYNVGFVLVIPLIFSVAQRYNLPVVYIGVPMMAALSVTHGFLPPHPSPTLFPYTSLVRSAGVAASAVR